MSLHLTDIWSAIKSRAGLQDDMRVFMHPQQLTVVRTKASNAKQIMVKKIVIYNRAESTGDIAGMDWSPAISALKNTLSDDCWSGARPQLVLSNHFVRYTLIPWNDGLSSRSERNAFLRHSFQLAYGDAARKWDLRISDNGFNKASLGSGIESQLLTDIQDTFSRAGFKLSAVYPHLMVAINSAQQQMVEPTYWFAVVETGRACIAMIREGQWVSVKSFVVSQHPEQMIVAAIERESIIYGIDTTHWPLVIYWPGRLDIAMVKVGHRKTVWIKPVRAPNIDNSDSLHGTLNGHVTYDSAI